MRRSRDAPCVESASSVEGPPPLLLGRSLPGRPAPFDACFASRAVFAPLSLMPPRPRWPPLPRRVPLPADFASSAPVPPALRALSPAVPGPLARGGPLPRGRASTPSLSASQMKEVRLLFGTPPPSLGSGRTCAPRPSAVTPRGPEPCAGPRKGRRPPGQFGSASQRPLPPSRDARKPKSPPF